MNARREKIEELVESLQALRRGMIGHATHHSPAPALPPSQWIALIYIKQHAPTSVKEVARALTITSSAATQLIDSLVENGYVVRTQDPRDRRGVSLTPSKKTRGHVAKMRRAAVRKFERMFSSLSDREFNQYCALSKKMITSMHSK
jgi:DNA-binding MarR family transcriptional regulator